MSQCSDKVAANNKFGFVPHMTLVKVSRPAARYIPTPYHEVFRYFVEDHGDHWDQLGTQPFDNLNLCVIDAETRPSDGFYQTLYQIKF